MLIASSIWPSAQAQMAPVAGTHYAARASDTGFSGAVNSQGSYGASVPLDLPPPRGNLPLPVQVAYGGNRAGAAGLGWDIPLSFIFRNTTIAHRRPVPQTTFSPTTPGTLLANEQLTLTLAGARFDLIRNAANTAWVARHGTAQLEVRQISDDLHLYDGEGRTYIFSPRGATAGSQLIDGNLYLLVEIRGSGSNKMVFDYRFEAPAVPGGGTGLAIDLTRVSYNPHPTTSGCFKHSVLFSYDTPPNPAPVLSMSVLGGTVLARTRKLDKVVVFSKPTCSEDETELRTYRFTYQPDTDIRLPRLQSVTMTGQSGTPERDIALPVASYTYGSITHSDGVIRYQSTGFQDVPPGPANHSLFGIAYTQARLSPEPHSANDELIDLFSDQMFIDVNGDGRIDFMGDGGWRLNVPGPNGQTFFQQVTGGGFSIDAREKIHSAILGVDTNMPARVNTVANDTLRQLIDMNGDGRLDLVETVPDRVDTVPDESAIWRIHLNRPLSGDPKLTDAIRIDVPVARMRQALATTGLTFGRVPMARRTTVPENFVAGSAANKRKRTITEFELKDVNGDGYPDFLYNASTVRRSDPQGGNGDMIGGRSVKVMYNTAGARLANGVHLFASPQTLVEESVSGCGISRWEADVGNVDGGVLNQVCGIEDIDGDGVADRIDSSVENGQVVAHAALGTGVPSAPFVNNARIKLPGPLMRTETALTLTNGNYAPTACVANPRETFDIRRTRALRDINGDGIPDYIAGQLQQQNAGTWTVALGTGVGFTTPSSVNVTLEPSRERSSCESARAPGVSATPTGMYDMDGDGQPEILELSRDIIAGLDRAAPPGTPFWRVHQLQPPVSQASGAIVNSVPAAGRLIRIDNGYGASTHVSYRSAKEDVVGQHNVPFPEIVVADVSTMDSSGTRLLSSTKYAHGSSSLIFDSVRDAFVFPGYDRSLQLVGNDPARPNDGTATITDLYRLAPFTAAQFPDATARFKRYQNVGRVSDVTTISGNLGTDPWALLNVAIATDTRRTAGLHYDYDVKLLTAGVKPANNEVCMDLMFPYDVTLSQTHSLSNDQCTLVGFGFQHTFYSWHGSPGSDANPNVIGLTAKSKSVVAEMDTLGRATKIAQLNDNATNDDDLCIRTSYATPTGSNERVLSAPASRTVTAGNCATNDETTLASESWEYDTSAGVKLPAGKVSEGFVTAHIVSRRRTDDGTTIPDANGSSDIRSFDAVYDALGNPTTVGNQREDGAVRSVATTYDAFGLVLSTVQVTAANEDGNALPPQLTTMSVDPVTLAVLNTTDPNGTQAGNTFDGFGRVLLSTVTPAAASSTGALSSVSYLGFATEENRDRRIVQKVFTDPVPTDTVATAAGRIGTLYIDSLGRPKRKDVELGADYGDQILHVGVRNYDLLGRVSFEAEPFPDTQALSTAYGTSYHFNVDGTPSCFVRGRGPQQFTELTDESSERYPTCFARRYENHREIVATRDADTLSPNPNPVNVVLHEATYDGVGRLLSRAKLRSQPRTALEFMDYAYDRFSNRTRLGRLFESERDGTISTISTTWQYDSLGQVLTLREPDSATQSRSYDTWGALTQTQWTDTTVTPAVTRSILQKYDALGRLLHTEERNNNVVDAETVNDYVYDRPMMPSTPSVPAMNVLGRLAKATSPTSAASFSYDGLGRMNAQVFVDTTVNPEKVYVEKHSLHADGSPISFDLLLPDANHRTERVSYTYDSAARVRSAVYTDGAITQNLFSAAGDGGIDVFGRIRQAQFGGATFTADFAETGRRLLNSVKVVAPSGASREIAHPAPTGRVSAFDALGRERARREIVSGVPTDLAFTYDGMAQLVSSTRTPVSAALPNMTFSYDMLGNVLTLDAATGNTDVMLNYQIVDRDRICSIGFGAAPANTCNVKYNGLGSIVQQPTRANGLRNLSYFANGLVKRVTDGNGNDARFHYDALGALQQLDLTSNTSADTRKDRHFGGMISQREEVVNGVRKVVTLRALSAPGVTATRHGPGTADPWTFVFGEQRGNRFFTNQAGEFVQDVDYQAYGEAKSSGAQPGSPNYSSEQWNGGDALAALGLSKLGARLYDPVIGRFLSRDPLIIPRTAATTNPYAFANNDPVNFSDPTGLGVEGQPPICIVCNAPGGHGGSVGGTIPGRNRYGHNPPLGCTGRCFDSKGNSGGRGGSGSGSGSGSKSASGGGGSAGSGANGFPVSYVPGYTPVTPSQGSGANGFPIGHSDASYTLHVRRYAPYETFGGGFEGDDRGPTSSLDAKRRTGLHIKFGAGKLIGATGSSSGCRTVCGFAKHAPFIDREGMPTISVGAVQNGSRISASSAGSNVLLPSPNIDTFIDFSTREFSGGLSISGQIRGNVFPATDLVLSDSAGRSILLGGTPDIGSPLLQLWGSSSDVALANFLAVVPVDALGSFQGTPIVIYLSVPRSQPGIGDFFPGSLR